MSEITIEELAKKVEELEFQLERTKAVNECANLMGRYLNYHTAFRRREHVELWAKRDDDILEMPWGLYRGYEGVKTCYMEHHVNREDEGSGPLMEGAVYMHHADTPVIEVAADGQTARGIWWSAGSETVPAKNPDGSISDDKQEAIWNHTRYGVDFIKEDGVWKFWRLHLYPTFRTAVGKSWTEPSQFSGPFSLGDDFQVPTDGPSTCEYWYMDRHTIYPVDQPDVPVPYETYSDLKKTWFGDDII